MRPEDLIAAAESLLAGTPGEAQCRLAAQACYTAALHMAAPHVGVDVGRDPVRHAKVRTAMRTARFTGTPPRHILVLANYFEDLARLRQHAEYWPDIPFDADHADQALEWMRGVLAAVGR
ncbi:MAG TPA: hypothetical protein VD860_01475 [Azospirillum sp.]|nr:hypothetical protein [Azospirillum sp.]